MGRTSKRRLAELSRREAEKSKEFLDAFNKGVNPWKDPNLSEIAPGQYEYSTLFTIGGKLDEHQELQIDKPEKNLLSCEIIIRKCKPDSEIWANIKQSETHLESLPAARLLGGLLKFVSEEGIHGEEIVSTAIFNTLQNEISNLHAYQMNEFKAFREMPPENLNYGMTSGLIFN